MPDSEHRVVYKAFADFTALYAEVAKAKAAMAALKRETGSTNVDRSNEIGQQRELNKVTREHVTAAEADAKAAAAELKNYKDLDTATRSLREQLAKLNAERQKAATPQTLGSTATWEPPWMRQQASSGSGSAGRDQAQTSRSSSSERAPLPQQSDTGDSAYQTRRTSSENAYQTRRANSESAFQARRASSENAYEARRVASENAYQTRRARSTAAFNQRRSIDEGTSALGNHAAAQDQAGAATERSIGRSRNYQRAFRDQMAVLREKRSVLQQHAKTHDETGRSTAAATERSREYSRVIRGIPKTPLATIDSRGVASLKDGTTWLDRMAVRIRDVAREAGHFDRGFVTAGDIVKGVWAGIAHGAQDAGTRIKGGLTDARAGVSRAFTGIGNVSHKTWGDIGGDITAAGRRIGDFVKGLGNVRSAVSRVGNIGDLFKFRAPTPAAAAGGGGTAGGAGLLSSFAEAGDRAAQSLSGMLRHLFSFQTMMTAAVAAAGPLIAALGALGGAALGAGNILVSLGGTLAAVPGLFAAIGAGVGALATVMGPLTNVFKAYDAVQKQTAAGSREQAQAASTAARAARQAEINYSSALKGVKDAQYDAKRAQQSLNEARLAAVRNLQDLRSELDRAGLNEQTATLAVKQAQADYRKALADPNATLLDREEALNRVNQAEADLSDVQQKNQRNQEDYNLAQKKGINGSDQVVAAQKAISDAQFNLVQSQQRVIDASLDLAKARKDEAAGGAQANTAQMAYKDQLDKLSPSTRKFAEEVLGLKGRWHDLQREVSEKLFAPIVGQLHNFPKLLSIVSGLLDSAAGAIGRVAAKGIAMVTSGPWKRDFATLADGNSKIISRLGDAGLYVADAFRNIVIAAQPFTTWLAGAIKTVAGEFDNWAKGARNSGGIATFLKDTEKRLKVVWDIVKNVVSFFGSLYTVTKDIGDFVLNGLDSMSKHWAAVGKAQEKHGSGLRTWLTEIKPLLKEIGHFIGQFVTSFAQIASDPKNIQEAKRIFGILADDILPKLVTLFSQISEHGFIGDILEALGTGLDAVNGAIKLGGGLPVKVLIEFFKKTAEFLKWVFDHPTVGAIFIGYFTALAAFAGAAVIGKLTGFFKLIEAFRWLVANKGALSMGLFDKIFGRDPGTSAAKKEAQSYNKEVDKPKGSNYGTYTRQLDTIIGLLRGIEECVCKCTTKGAASPVANEAAEDGAAGALKASAAALDAAAEALVGAATALKGAAAAEDLGGLGRGGKGAAKGAARAAEKEAAKGAAKGAARAAEGSVAKGAARGAAGAAKGAAKGAAGAAEAGAAKGAAKGAAEAGVAKGAAAAAERGGILGAVGRGFKRFTEPLRNDSGFVRLPGRGDAAELLTDTEQAATRGAKGAVTRGAEGAATSAVEGAAVRGVEGAAVRGVEKTAGRGLLRAVGKGALSVGKGALALDPLTVGGIGLSLAADSGLLGKKGSTGKQLGQAGGAVLTGAGIGATIGSVVPGVGTAIGAGVGALAGAAYSLAKDKGLRDKIGGFFESIGKWFADVGKSVGGWVNSHLIKPVVSFFTGVGHWFADIGKSIGGFVNRYFIKPIVAAFTAIGRILAGIGEVIFGFAYLAGKWLYDHVVKPIIDFFLGIAQSVAGWVGRVVKSAYENIILPIINFFLGISQAVAGWVGRIAKLAYDNVLTPVGHFFAAIGRFFASIASTLAKAVSSAASWVYDNILTPIGHFFTSIGKGAAALVGRVGSWIGDHIITPIGNFFSGIGHGISNLVGRIGSWISDHIIRPITDFFGGIGRWISNLGKSVKEWAAKQGPAGKFIVKGLELIGFAQGGKVRGVYRGVPDTEVAALTPGEMVVRRERVQDPAAQQFVEDWNAGRIDPGRLYAALADNKTGGGGRWMDPSSLYAALGPVGGAGAAGALTPTTRVPTSVSHSVDNSKHSGLTTGDITINNPVRERSTRSLRRTLHASAYMLNR